MDSVRQFISPEQQRQLQQQQAVSVNRYQLVIPASPVIFDVESLQGQEAISQLYRYQINATCLNVPLDATPLLRQAVSLRCYPPRINKKSPPSEPLKIVPGIITQLQRLSASKEEIYYQFILEPRCSLLRYSMRSFRCFLHQSVTEVVEKILREHGVVGWQFEFSLKQRYPKRPQINQVNETDWAFIERLLSQVGIFYTFRLQPDTQTEVLCFADSIAGYQQVASLPYQPLSGLHDNGRGAIWAITLQQQVVSQSLLTKDDDFHQSPLPLQSAIADMTRGDGDNTNYGQVYRYQTGHTQLGDPIFPEPETANFWARLEHERLLVSKNQIRGKSSEVSLAPAQVFSLTGAESLPALLHAPLLLITLTVSASRQHAWLMEFSAMDYQAANCYRPPFIAKPVIAGTMVAKVVSPDAIDKYAHINQQGLYWVKFNADIDKQRMGYSSLPVRLAKPYAGDNYGFHFPIIQGTEVAIAFQQGDPDRPYIAHVLHNSYNPDLVTAKNHTRNVIRTPANNKLRMEDKRGQEHVKLSSEYGGKSQLNLGHLVNNKDEARGEGFELRTDSVGAIRAGKGLFITTEQQDAAQGQQLAMQSVIDQLDSALSLAYSLQQSAKVADQQAGDSQSQHQLTEQLKQLNQAGLLLYGQQGLANVTPDSLQLTAGKEIHTTAQQTHINSFKQLLLAAGQGITAFARKLAIKLIAAEGNISIQAQRGKMGLLADQNITLSSVNDSLRLQAKQGIELVCGGGGIRILANGKVEVFSADTVELLAPTLLFNQGKSIKTDTPLFKQNTLGRKAQLCSDEEGQEERPLANQAFQLIKENGEVLEGVTDEQGCSPLLDLSSTEQFYVQLSEGNEEEKE